MPRLTFYLICSVITISRIQGQLPSFIKPCDFTSPDFGQCAIKNGNAAIPSILEGIRELDIPSFKPLKIPHIEFSSGDLTLNGTNVIVTGFDNFVITDILLDKEKRLMRADLINPFLELNFHINIGGKIGSLRIEGNGPTKIIVYDATYAYNFFYNTIEKKGKTYASFSKDDFLIKPSNLSIHIDNLFDGNKLLGDNTNKFLNENWPEVLTELRPVINEIVGSIIRKMLVNLFEKAPLEEMFLGY